MKIDIKTKRIYDKAERGDGFRLLVTRLWPRGIRLEDVNLWLRDLGPTRDLLLAYKGGKVRWPTFEKRYLGELDGDPARKALVQLFQSVDRPRVTLLCACKDLKKCHTAPLRRSMMRWLKASL